MPNPTNMETLESWGMFGKWGGVLWLPCCYPTRAYMDLMGIWTIYLVAKSTDPCETIIQGPKWQLVSNSSDLLFGDVDPHLLSTHLFNHWVQITMSKGKIGHGTFFQPSGSEGEDVTYCLLNFHHPVGGQPLEKPWKSLRCWDQDDLEWMELGRTYLELAWKLISFGGMCWCDCRHSCRCWFCSIWWSWPHETCLDQKQNLVIVPRWKVKIHWDFAWPKKMR